ncbi:hypothetical protein BDQ12DRAFT_602657 [Crucibulum laeve]|uniref:Uncharacterized protein n=1 Tax=Crucibulum laeve TaxID=68775 RepID=A0A5C3M4G8_9AGAR|nr:hypothetical protein BDQ12DRAFT_602657 [Crucibulum laeve]
MSHSTKAKAKGISASSFFDLKAELSKQEEQFTKNKAAGKSSTLVGGVKRPDKKPTVWARPNKGVNARAERDIELEAISKPTLESARAALERKAKIYDKLRKGKSGGLNDKQYDALLVDFDSKPIPEFYESDSDDVDESLEVPKGPQDKEDDPIVEYEDEFGRMRTAHKSEVPRHLLPRSDEEADEDEDIIIRNPVNHFPVYEPSAERIAEIAKAHAEENNPLNMHYDASQEVRAKGAGFYQFSGDEETRQAQMEELKAARGETERTRHETGAVDLRPGEMEGMQPGEAAGSSSKSRAMEKRKREVEERRKMLEAKRRKTTKSNEGTSVATSSAAVERSASPRPALQLPSSPSDNPFVALEAQSMSPPKTDKGKAKAIASVNPADAFLAQLENDFLNSKVKKTR